MPYANSEGHLQSDHDLLCAFMYCVVSVNSESEQGSCDQSENV